MTRIMGIDPSLRSAGVADPEGRLFTLNPGLAVGGQRLHMVAGAIAHLCRQTKPDVVIGEALILHGPGAGGAQARAELIGCIKRDLYEHAIDYVEVNPARLKRWATGHGDADKGAKDKPMMRAAAEALGYRPANSDEADAALLRELGRHAYDDEVADNLTVTGHVTDARLEVVAAITWPTL